MNAKKIIGFVAMGIVGILSNIVSELQQEKMIEEKVQKALNNQQKEES